MRLTEEQLNFLARANITGHPLNSSILGDRLDGHDCDERARKQCRQMVENGYLYEDGNGYRITDKGREAVKDRDFYQF